MRELLFIMGCAIVSSCTQAEVIGDNIDVDNITVDSVDLSINMFYQSLISKEPQQRHAANLYLLGVMDAAEGDVWCDYKTFKTTTLRARIYEELKKSSNHKQDTRASKKIIEILKHQYPCKD